MNRSEKQLASKANFITFLQLSCSNLSLKSVKGLKVNKSCEQNQVLTGLWQKQKIVSRENHSKNI